MSDYPPVFVQIGDFDESRCVIKEPVKNSFKQGNETIEWTTSQGLYLNESGDPCELYLEFEEQTVFGFNEQYKMGLKEEDKTPAKLEGYQVAYPLTSMKSIESPTEREQACMDVLSSLHRLTVEKLTEECEKKKTSRLVPAATYSAYSAAKNDEESGGADGAVKPAFAHPSLKDKSGKNTGEPDTTKPMRTYFKLLTVGKGKKLKVVTPIYGPGDTLVQPAKYNNRRGKISPLIKWEGVYWGAHGSDSPYGASVKLRLAECNFTPHTDGAPAHRMLAPNKAPKEDDISDDGSDEDSRVKNPYVKPVENGSGSNTEDFKASSNPVEVMMGTVDNEAGGSDSGAGPAPAVVVSKPSKTKGSKSKGSKSKSGKKKKVVVSNSDTE